MADLVKAFRRVNGQELSWNSCEFGIELVPYDGIVGVSFGDSRERGVVKAMQKDGAPLNFTSGTYKVDSCKIRFLTLDFYKKCIPQLELLAAAQGQPGSYGDAIFDMNMKISEPGMPENTLIVAFNTCAISKPTETFDEGVEATVVECEMQVLTLTRNGSRLWSRVRGNLI